MYAAMQGQKPEWLRILARLLEVGPELATLLLAFTLCIFVLLVFAVRTVMVIRKMPVPADLFDMPKPRGFRMLMLGFTVVLTPLVARDFLPIEGLDPQWALGIVYALTILLAALIWLALELFYRARGERKSR
jgi:hypothetical protein